LEYLEAFLLGLVGSLHCAGMCGPIAVALPLNNESWFTRITGGLLYNTGRTITYAFLGAVLGLAGMGLSLGGLQQWASILLGIAMILAILVPRLGAVSKPVYRLSDFIAGILKKPFSSLFRTKTYRSLFVIGLLNGFLPCGLVYIALAGALVMSHAAGGALYMALFGLGTAPMLLVISLAGNILSQKLRARLSKVIPVFIVMLGIIFILRGLNLGIPYLSPKIDKANDQAVIECCESKK